MGMKIKILHVNIRSAQKHFDDFLVFIEQFKLHDVDVIVFSETRVINNVANFTIPGFATSYNSSVINQCDGVLIYVKSNINFNIDHVILSESKVTVSKITFTAGNINYCITGCYRSPSTNVNTFIDDLETYLSRRQQNNVDIFIGDINIDILNNTSAITNKYMSMLMSTGFESCINSYTRVTTESNTCIDHIFVRSKLAKNNYTVKAVVLDTNITDHYPIFMSLYQNSNDSNAHGRETGDKTVTILDDIKFLKVMSTIK